MADACECGNEPLGSVKCGDFLTSCKPVSFSRMTLHHGVSKYIHFVLLRKYRQFYSYRKELDSFPDVRNFKLNFFTKISVSSSQKKIRIIWNIWSINVL